MLVDMIVGTETLLTINTKSVDFLLETQNTTRFPVLIGGQEIIIQFRKEAQEFIGTPPLANPITDNKRKKHDRRQLGQKSNYTSLGGFERRTTNRRKITKTPETT